MENKMFKLKTKGCPICKECKVGILLQCDDKENYLCKNCFAVFEDDKQAEGLYEEDLPLAQYYLSEFLNRNGEGK